MNLWPNDPAAANSAIAVAAKIGDHRLGVAGRERSFVRLHEVAPWLAGPSVCTQQQGSPAE